MFPLTFTLKGPHILPPPVTSEEKFSRDLVGTQNPPDMLLSVIRMSHRCLKTSQEASGPSDAHLRLNSRTEDFQKNLNRVKKKTVTCQTLPSSAQRSIKIILADMLLLTSSGFKHLQQKIMFSKETSFQLKKTGSCFRLCLDFYCNRTTSSKALKAPLKVLRPQVETRG